MEQLLEPTERLGDEERPHLGTALHSGLEVLGVTRSYQELDSTGELPRLGCGFWG